MPTPVRYHEAAGRWVLLATVLGSALAFIDGTVVNIALPRIGEQFGAGAAPSSVDRQRVHPDAGLVRAAGRIAG